MYVLKHICRILRFSVNSLLMKKVPPTSPFLNREEGGLYSQNSVNVCGEEWRKMGPITESCRLRGLGKFEMCSVSGKGYSLYQNCYYCRYQALLTWRSRQDQKRKVPHT